MPRLFVDRLTLIDISYLHPERGLLGESWLLDVELEGELDYQGMVLDFGLIKQRVKRIVDSRFDHKLLVPAGYAGTRLERRGADADLRFRTLAGAEIRYAGPDDALAFLEAPEVTPESASEAICTVLQPELPENIRHLGIRLRNEPPDRGDFQVSHGLKHHEGNCQRIAHGHRSRLEIYRDGSRDRELEAHWGALWRDIYIGSREDLLQETEAYAHFGYTAPQGRFELTLPRERCYLIDTDSTVENLAQHIADTLKRGSPRSRFRVKVFEGVDKGAVVEC